MCLTQEAGWFCYFQANNKNGMQNSIFSVDAREGSWAPSARIIWEVCNIHPIWPVWGDHLLKVVHNNLMEEDL